MNIAANIDKNRTKVKKTGIYSFDRIAQLLQVLFLNLPLREPIIGKEPVKPAISRPENEREENA